MTLRISMVFSRAGKGVNNSRYMTTEALEHTFGAYHAERKEAKVLGFTEIEDKFHWRTNSSFWELKSIKGFKEGVFSYVLLVC